MQIPMYGPDADKCLKTCRPLSVEVYRVFDSALQGVSCQMSSMDSDGFAISDERCQDNTTSRRLAWESKGVSL